jgi:hypothetical protein
MQRGRRATLLLLPARAVTLLQNFRGQSDRPEQQVGSQATAFAAIFSFLAGVFYLKCDDGNILRLRLMSPQRDVGGNSSGLGVVPARC